MKLDLINLSFKRFLHGLYIKIIDFFFAIIDLRQLPKIIFDPSFTRCYFPDEPRKNKFQIFCDLIYWWITRGEVNQHYYLYGMDTKLGPDPSEFIGRIKAIRIRDNKNIYRHENKYTILMNDKYIFGIFLYGLGLPTPKILALVDNGRIFWKKPNADIESLQDLQLASTTVFCKLVNGECGHGIYKLQWVNRRFFVNNTPIKSPQKFFDSLAGRYILQESIRQHEKMEAMYSHCINSLKINTIIRETGPEVYYSFMRFGGFGSPVDNWRTGSSLVKVDYDSGKCEKYGYLRQQFGGRIERHPDSGRLFEGFEIPFYNQAKEMVLYAHTQIPKIQQIGWDLAITPDGPSILEGNDNWDVTIPQVLDQRDGKNGF